jgi:hypothetical protein
MGHSCCPTNCPHTLRKNFRPLSAFWPFGFGARWECIILSWMGLMKPQASHWMPVSLDYAVRYLFNLWAGHLRLHPHLEYLLSECLQAYHRMPCLLPHHFCPCLAHDQLRLPLDYGFSISGEVEKDTSELYPLAPRGPLRGSSAKEGIRVGSNGGSPGHLAGPLASIAVGKQHLQWTSSDGVSESGLVTYKSIRGVSDIVRKALTQRSIVACILARLPPIMPGSFSEDRA